MSLLEDAMNTYQVGKTHWFRGRNHWEGEAIVMQRGGGAKHHVTRMLVACEYVTIMRGPPCDIRLCDIRSSGI